MKEWEERIDKIEYLNKRLDDIRKEMDEYMEENSDYIRMCDECGHLMNEGFVVESGIEYYCSEECLHKHITEEEWEELYDDGNGDSYWTEWR